MKNNKLFLGFSLALVGNLYGMQGYEKVAQSLVEMISQGSSRDNAPSSDIQTQIAQLSHLVRGKNETIAGLRRTIVQKDAEINRLNSLKSEHQEAFKDLEEAIEGLQSDNPEKKVSAWFDLMIYYTGKDTEADHERGFKYATLAGSDSQIYRPSTRVFSRMVLGRLYYFGQGTRQDYDRAFICFKLSANEETITNEPALKASVYMGLANCYYFGHGTEKNYNEAFKYYKFAHDEKEANGNDRAEASLRLGDCYYFGYGAEKNHQKAFKYYLQAAMSNADTPEDRAEARLKLGHCYYFGEGTRVDRTKANSCFTEVANDAGCDDQTVKTEARRMLAIGVAN